MDQGSGEQGRGDSTVEAAEDTAERAEETAERAGSEPRNGAAPEEAAQPEAAAQSEEADIRDPRAVVQPPADRPGMDDVAAISRLKFRYLRALDTKSWEEFADTMIPEATATYSEYLQFESRDAFLAFMRNTLGPHVITEHRCDHPEIDVEGDTATGTWYLADTVLIPAHNMLLRGAAFYTDRYARCEDGQWRIAHTGYERTYEVVLSLSDLPSLRLTSSRWGLIAREDGIAPVEREPGAAPVHQEPEAE